MSELTLHRDRIGTAFFLVAGPLMMLCLAFPNRRLEEVLVLLAFLLLGLVLPAARWIIRSPVTTHSVPCGPGAEWWILAANELLSFPLAVFAALLLPDKMGQWALVLAILMAGAAAWRIIRWSSRGKLRLSSPDFVLDPLGCALYAALGVGGILYSWNVGLVGFCLMIGLTFALRTVWAVMYPERCVALAGELPASEIP